jgi:hypothetical protein
MVLVSVPSFCQQTIVKGKITDSLHNSQPLKGATVIVQTLPDSISRAMFITEEDGLFQFRNLGAGIFRIKVLYIAYAEYSTDISLDKNNREADLGIIRLVPEATDLGNVTVSSATRKRAITVKQDTIEFNAASYQVRPNAVLADLLRKLPGIEVDKNGSVKVQGETVQKIMIDGTSYFANDPKLAVMTLPPDIIDKVQVVNNKTQKEKFTGFSDGKRSKAINIVTKRKARSMYFGKAVGGIGTTGRYSANADLARLNGTEQLSIIGGADNTNQLSYGGQSSNGGDVAAFNAGINYKNAVSKKTDLSGSYHYAGSKSLVESQSFTENVIREDSAIYNDRSSSTRTNNKPHAFNLNLESRIDSNTLLTFNSSAYFFDRYRTINTNTNTTTGQLNRTEYRSINNDNETSTGFDLSGVSLYLQKRFRKPHRSLFVDLSFSSGNQDDDKRRNTVNIFIRPVAALDSINQRVIGKSRRSSFSPKITYTEPLGANSAIEMNYAYNIYKDNSEENSYDFSKGSNSYTGFDSLFSTSFRNTTSAKQFSMIYRLQREKYSFSAGTGMQFTDLTSTDLEKGSTLKTHFTTVTPNLSFNYAIGRSVSLSVNYGGYNNELRAEQLQPVLVTQDSINFYIGNPNLKQSFSHNLYAQVYSFRQESGTSLSFSLNGSKVDNDIRPSITNNADGGRTITYTNLSGSYMVSGFVNYGFPLRVPKSNINLSSNIMYDARSSLVDGFRNDTRNTALSGSAGWTSAFANKIDASVRIDGTYNFVKNSLQSEQNDNYFSQRYSADMTYYPESGWLFNMQFNYTHSMRPQTEGYNADIILLHCYIARQFLKDKSAEIKLAAYDLFHDNESVSRYVAANMIRDVRTKVPGRFVMLSVTYNLRQKIR